MNLTLTFRVVVVVLFVLATAGLISLAACAALNEWDIDAGTWVAIIAAYVSLVSPLFVVLKDGLAEADHIRETLRLSAQEELRTLLPKRQDAYTKLYSALSRLIPPK